MLLYLILVTVGAVSIYAASYDFDNASLFDLNEFSGKQILWIGLSLIVGLVILLMDYRIFKIYAYPIYGIVLVVLLVTIFIAPNTKGSHSWLVFGPVSLQPAEFGKFATALCLAKLFDSYNFILNQKISNYFRALIIIFLPIILILLQRETGSALVYVSFIFVLYREGMSGLVLFSVLCAVTFFVVAVKFADPLILGIPMGEFTVYLLIMLIFVCMLLFYCKDGIVGRNVLIGFACSGVIVSVLAFFGIVLNGTIYFLSALGLGIVYTLLSSVPHFLIGLIRVLVSSFLSSLYILAIRPLSDLPENSYS